MKKIKKIFLLSISVSLLLGSQVFADYPSSLLGQLFSTTYSRPKNKNLNNSVPPFKLKALFGNNGQRVRPRPGQGGGPRPAGQPNGNQSGTGIYFPTAPSSPAQGCTAKRLRKIIENLEKAMNRPTNPQNNGTIRRLENLLLNCQQNQGVAS